MLRLYFIVTENFLVINVLTGKFCCVLSSIIFNILILVTTDTVQKMKMENTVDQHVLKVEIKTEVEELRDQLENQVSVFVFSLFCDLLGPIKTILESFCRKMNALSPGYNTFGKMFCRCQKN
jgi:hypothetical protein